MKIKRKTGLNILLIVFVVSFFITPVGYWSKVWLTRLFTFDPELEQQSNLQQIPTYDWKLRDAEGQTFNFERSKGDVVFINLWASWLLPSAAELNGIQKLADEYQGKVDFYIITNEERYPVEEFMKKNDYDFPVTYRIVGEKSPIDTTQVPATYILDKLGKIRVHQKGIADWDNDKVRGLLDSLIAE
jgi:thiol-disulfide isomerase/thioredoxin